MSTKTGIIIAVFIAAAFGGYYFYQQNEKKKKAAEEAERQRVLKQVKTGGQSLVNSGLLDLGLSLNI